jgi:hypothetical protein
MSKRIWGFSIIAAALSLLLAAAFLGSTQGGAAAGPDRGGGRQPLGVWQTVAPLPTISLPPTPGSYPARIKRANAAAYANGKIYLLGGRHGVDGEDFSLRWIWEYTPGSPGAWVQKTALLDGSAQGAIFTSNMAVAALTDSNGPRIYAIGGSSIDSVPTSTVRIYNPVADSLTTLTSDPWPASPARIPGGWAVVNNKLYIFGGFSALGSGAVFNDTWRFDPLGPAGGRWTQLPSATLSLGRGYIAGVTLDGAIYAIGGDTWQPGAPGTLLPVTNVERLDPAQANPTWTSLAALPTARGDMGAWAYDSNTNYEISGRIAVAGGHHPIPDAQGYLYNPGTNSWATFPNLLQATRNYGTAQLDGYLYAFGGYDYTNNLPNGANWNQRYNATVPLATATATPTRPPAALVGHVSWQGRPAQPDPLNQLPLSLTLQLGTAVTTYPNQQTDASGFFTVPVTTLPNGVYTWWAKGTSWLASGGSLTLAGAPVTQQEMGLQLAGDVDNGNQVDINDFTFLRATFGLVCGNGGYDGRADFTGNCVVDTSDFTLLRGNFGQTGPPPP